MNSPIDLLQSEVLQDSLKFLPELVLCGGIVLLLLLRLFKAFDRSHLGGAAMLTALLAMAVSLAQWKGLSVFDEPGGKTGGKADVCFGGLLVYDHFAIFVRLFLYGFTALIIWLTRLTGIPDREDSADFYCLLLGATLGMAVMATANHLLMVYLGVEMASLPSYALAGFLKGRRPSSEAALKYVVYGGGASGVMLYGISLLAGKFGTAYLPDLAVQFVRSFHPGVAPEALHLLPEQLQGVVRHVAPGGSFDPVLVLALLFILVGVAFKLAAVPFHFWCPDVFEGASAEVAGFLSVASKGAALALLARVGLVLAGLDNLITAPTDANSASLKLPYDVDWRPVVQLLVPALGFFAALTATFGNLAAYRQTNLKRLLAYSTIAHAGYMMMGLAVLTRDGAGAVLFYLIAYLFMNLGAFAVVAFLRNQTGSEDLGDFRGLVRRSPWMVVTLSFFLLSLLGMPPLVGFVAKINLFAALYTAGQAYAAQDPFLAGVCFALFVIAGLNTVFSAVYYIKVMRVMIIENRAEDLEGLTPKELPEKPQAVTYALLTALATLALGVLFNPLLDASKQGVERFQIEKKVKDEGSPLAARQPDEERR